MVPTDDVKEDTVVVGGFGGSLVRWLVKYIWWCLQLTVGLVENLLVEPSSDNSRGSFMKG